MEVSKSLHIITILFNTSPASGKESQEQFFPLHLKFLSKVIILFCGLWGEWDGGCPLCSWYDGEECYVNSHRPPSLSFGRSARGIAVGIIYHAASGVPNLQAVANFQRQ